MTPIRKNLIRTVFLLGVPLLPTSHVLACNCAGASMYGDQMKVFVFPNAKKQITVNNSVELPKINSQMATNHPQHRYNIDVRHNSVLIDFKNSTSGAASYGPGASFTFEGVHPRLAAGNCTPKITGINLQTNKADATWLNSKATFSDHTFKVVFGHHIDPQDPNATSTRWEQYHWIKVNLTFGCSAPPPPTASTKRGMTWGFAGWSKITDNGTNFVCPQSGVAKLGCNSAAGSTPENDPCGYLSNSTLWNTPVTGNGTRSCDAYNGDTLCSEKKYILCVAEPDNPYFQRLPPYHQPNNNPATPYFTMTPPPGKRPRYMVEGQGGSMPPEFYNGWVDQPVKLTREKYAGTALQNPANADQLCGNGWRMAEFHDGRWMPGMNWNTPTFGNSWNPASTRPGGWAFHAGLAADRNMGTDDHPANSGSNARANFMKERYWVKNNNTNANCWD